MCVQNMNRVILVYRIRLPYNWITIQLSDTLKANIYLLAIKMLACVNLAQNIWPSSDFLQSQVRGQPDISG